MGSGGRVDTPACYDAVPKSLSPILVTLSPYACSLCPCAIVPLPYCTGTLPHCLVALIYSPHCLFPSSLLPGPMAIAPNGAGQWARVGIKERGNVGIVVGWGCFNVLVAVHSDGYAGCG